MKAKRWKLFLDFEKEEKWLNKMAAVGFAMTHFSLGRYTFEECAAGEYIYRIELLKNSIADPESIKYIHFMEDNGAEHVASYLNWVYFRKKAIEGPFEIYSDLESRIRHYQRLVRLWIIIGLVFLVAILAQIGGIIDFIENGYQDIPFHIANYLLWGALIILDAVLISRFLPRYIGKVKRLKRERDVRE